jgi:TfoX/Sxy family transcriptional regulator of competence genes
MTNAHDSDTSNRATSVGSVKFDLVGAIEDELREQAEDALAELAGLDVRRMFSGWGFYCRGLLFAAAWDGEFRLRARERGRWIYTAVDRDLLSDPDQLLRAAGDNIAKLELEPEARPRKKPPRRSV